MKVAVFSDVQANLPPMQTVVEHILAWRPDLVIMNGDLVNRGPDSLGCLTLFERLRKAHDWIALRGNHEDFVLHCRETNSADLPAWERPLRQFTDWTSRQLGQQADVMRAWGDDFRFSPPADPEARVSAMHGSMLGNRSGIMPHIDDEELARRIPPGLSVFLTAHTHRPLIRRFNGCEIVNSGSAGSPFDGDPRASYAQLEYRDGAWRPTIIRLDYDREATEKTYHDSGFLDEGGPIARLIFEEWKNAASLMPAWRRQYMEAIRQGDISADQAVEAFLA